jgi:hypothetical protein
MNIILKCRRTIVSILGIAALTALGYFKGQDVATSIAAIAIGLASANSYEKSKTQGQ